MNVIFVPKIGGRGSTVRLSGKMLFFFGVLSLVGVVGLVFGGFYLGAQQGGYSSPADLVSEWHDEMDKQRNQISEARRNAEENLDALAKRMGRLQAHVLRLDALGERLTKMAKLDAGEFDFSEEPAQGGPVSPSKMNQTFDVPNFIASLNTLSSQIDDRAQQLDLLEALLMSQELEKQVVPKGRPISRGWLSSYFGVRADPFTGKKAMHKGLDFAGKMGSDIVAVASGVVTWADTRYGYGRMVEVNHGNGYSTRYGHAKELLVKVGQKVLKGDVLAAMGSSGRSTGPHVHFEVLKNGKQVDPIHYIRRK